MSCGHWTLIDFHSTAHGVAAVEMQWMPKSLIIGCPLTKQQIKCESTRKLPSSTKAFLIGCCSSFLASENAHFVVVVVLDGLLASVLWAIFFSFQWQRRIKWREIFLLYIFVYKPKSTCNRWTNWNSEYNSTRQFSNLHVLRVHCTVSSVH